MATPGIRLPLAVYDDDLRQIGAVRAGDGSVCTDTSTLWKQWDESGVPGNLMWIRDDGRMFIFDISDNPDPEMASRLRRPETLDRMCIKVDDVCPELVDDYKKNGALDDPFMTVGALKRSYANYDTAKSARLDSDDDPAKSARLDSDDDPAKSVRAAPGRRMRSAPQMSNEIVCTKCSHVQPSSCTTCSNPECGVSLKVYGLCK